MFIDKDDELYSRMCKAKLLTSAVRSTYSLVESTVYINNDGNGFDDYANKKPKWTLKRGNPEEFYEDEVTEPVLGYTLNLQNARISDTVDGNIWIGGQFYNITVSDFITTPDTVSHIRQAQQIKSFHQNYSDIILDDIGSAFVNAVIKNIPVANVAVAVVETGIKIYQVHLNNEDVVDCLNSIKEETVFQAMEIGYSLNTIGKPDILMNFVIVNQTMLQIKVNAYNNYKEDEDGFQNITREELEDELDIIFTEGQTGETLLSFTSWCSGHESDYDAYKTAIGRLLDSYTNKNPQKFPNGIILEELTPEQINILDEVYRGEKTVDEIEL